MRRDEMEKLAEEKTASVLKGFRKELREVHGVDLGPKQVGPIIRTLVKHTILNTLADGAVLARGLASDLEIGAYNAGRDCAYDGPNSDNSDKTLFENEKTSAAWERGNQDGHAEIASAKDVAEGA